MTGLRDGDNSASMPLVAWSASSRSLVFDASSSGQPSALQWDNNLDQHEPPFLQSSSSTFVFALQFLPASLPIKDEFQPLFMFDYVELAYNPLRGLCAFFQPADDPLAGVNQLATSCQQLVPPDIALHTAPLPLPPFAWHQVVMTLDLDAGVSFVVNGTRVAVQTNASVAADLGAPGFGFIAPMNLVQIYSNPSFRTALADLQLFMADLSAHAPYFYGHRTTACNAPNPPAPPVPPQPLPPLPPPPSPLPPIPPPLPPPPQPPPSPSPPPPPLPPPPHPPPPPPPIPPPPWPPPPSPPQPPSPSPPQPPPPTPPLPAPPPPLPPPPLPPPPYPLPPPLPPTPSPPPSPLHASSASAASSAVSVGVGVAIAVSAIVCACPQSPYCTSNSREPLSSLDWIHACVSDLRLCVRACGRPGIAAAAIGIIKRRRIRAKYGLSEEWRRNHAVMFFLGFCVSHQRRYYTPGLV